MGKLQDNNRREKHERSEQRIILIRKLIPQREIEINKIQIKKHQSFKEQIRERINKELSENQKDRKTEIEEEEEYTTVLRTITEEDNGVEIRIASEEWQNRYNPPKQWIIEQVRLIQQLDETENQGASLQDKDINCKKIKELLINPEKENTLERKIADKKYVIINGILYKRPNGLHKNPRVVLTPTM